MDSYGLASSGICTSAILVVPVIAVRTLVMVLVLRYPVHRYAAVRAGYRAVRQLRRRKRHERVVVHRVHRHGMRTAADNGRGREDRRPGEGGSDQLVRLSIDHTQHGDDDGLAVHELHGSVGVERYIVSRRQEVVVVTRVKPHLVRPALAEDPFHLVAIAGADNQRLSVLQAAADQEMLVWPEGQSRGVAVVDLEQLGDLPGQRVDDRDRPLGCVEISVMNGGSSALLTTARM